MKYFLIGIPISLSTWSMITPHGYLDRYLIIFSLFTLFFWNQLFVYINDIVFFCLNFRYPHPWMNLWNSPPVSKIINQFCIWMIIGIWTRNSNLSMKQLKFWIWQWPISLFQCSSGKCIGKFQKISPKNGTLPLLGHPTLFTFKVHKK